MPIVALASLFLFVFLPKIDPLKKNIEKFRTHYDAFILLMTAFFAYLSGLIIAWNLGYHFNMSKAMLPALGVLFILIGTILKHTKRNWFIGIRTPWTLTSDEVWERTHKMGSRLFIISGIIAIFGIFFEEYSVIFVLSPLVISIAYLFLYSYIIYKK